MAVSRAEMEFTARQVWANPLTRVGGRLNYFNFDNTASDPLILSNPRNQLAITIQYAEGGLEEVHADYIQGIKMQNPRLKTLQPLEYQDLLTAALFDVTQTGESLRKSGLAIVGERDIFQCPPVAVTFS